MTEYNVRFALIGRYYDITKTISIDVDGSSIYRLNSHPTFNLIVRRLK